MTVSSLGCYPTRLGSAESFWMCTRYATVHRALLRPSTRWIWADASELWKVLLSSCSTPWMRVLASRL
eukprot:7994691-Pyramimonas_sp.AAC.1